MACYVKLKEDTYIQWSKVADAPASKLLNSLELKKCLEEEEVALKILNHPFSAKSTYDLIESTGTSDLSGVVTLDFILEYNSLGEAETPINDVNQLIELLKNK